jgi:hypothetical protein
MYTLHHAAELRGIDSVEDLNSVPSTVKPHGMRLAKQVIETFEGPLDLANYKDEYREGLQRIIDAKVAGEEVVAAPVEAAESRQPDGGPEEEPQRRRYLKKETGEGVCGHTREVQTRVSCTPPADDSDP